MIYKTIFSTILLICVAVFNLFAQEENANINVSDTNALAEHHVVEDNKIYEASEVEVMAEPSVDMRKFLEQNIQYPDQAKMAGTQGRVRVALKFIVEKDGSLTNIEIDEKSNIKQEKNHPEGVKALKDEAMRVMKLLPNFRPATINGKAVRSLMIQHIFFRLD